MAVNILVVDGDGNGPDVQGRYTAALPAGTFSVWDLAESSKLPLNYLKAFKSGRMVHGQCVPGADHTVRGGTDPVPRRGWEPVHVRPGHPRPGGGHHAFVKNYLHIDWDDRRPRTTNSTASGALRSQGTLTNGLGTVALDHSVLGATFEDQITPISPAQGDLHR